jgi:hypothetical protein
MRYRVARNPRPHVRPRFFLMPITAEPVMPAEDRGDALQAKEAPQGRREGLLRDVRVPHPTRWEAQPADAVDAGAPREAL